MTTPTNQRIFTTAAAASLWLAAGCANANLLDPALDQWGAGAATFTCTSAAPACTFATRGAAVGTLVDNFHQLGADSTLAVAQGVAEAHALLSHATGLDLPHLAAKAQGGTQVAKASAWALQGYQFAGTGADFEPVTKTLTIDLTGSISNPHKSAATFISAKVWILNPFEIEALGGGITQFDAGDVAPLYEANVSLGHPATVALDLYNGDAFYLWAELTASAAPGAIADASHTLSLKFDNNSGLSSTTAVPLSATVWLLGSALLGGGVALPRRTRG